MQHKDLLESPSTDGGNRPAPTATIHQRQRTLKTEAKFRRNFADQIEIKERRATALHFEIA